MISEFYNGDCMDGMKQYPDGFFDLAIVDPPYGKNISNLSEIGYKGFNRYKPKIWDAKVPSPQYFEELMRVSENQIIWGGNYFRLEPSKSFIIWDKGEGFYNRTYAECELAWTSLDKNAKIYKRDPLSNGDYKRKIHINQKPVALYKWLLNNYAKPGDKILDTHVGSGSSRIACWDLGFDFYGWELDPDYYKSAEQRFQNHIKKYTIDDDKNKAAEQYMQMKLEL